LISQSPFLRGILRNQTLKNNVYSSTLNVHLTRPRVSDGGVYHFVSFPDLRHGKGEVCKRSAEPLLTSIQRQCGNFDRVGGLPVFWQHAVELLVGHAGEAVEEVFEILKGFVAVAFGTFDQGVKDGAAFPGVFFADEQPVLLADRRWADGVLNEVVVCLDLSVVKEGFELRPKVERVVDGTT